MKTELDEDLEVGVLSVDEEAQRGQRRSEFGRLAARRWQEAVIWQLLEGLQRRDVQFTEKRM